MPISKQEGYSYAPGSLNVGPVPDLSQRRRIIPVSSIDPPWRRNQSSMQSSSSTNVMSQYPISSVSSGLLIGLGIGFCLGRLFAR